MADQKNGTTRTVLITMFVTLWPFLAALVCVIIAIITHAVFPADDGIAKKSSTSYSVELVVSECWASSYVLSE